MNDVDELIQEYSNLNTSSLPSTPLTDIAAEMSQATPIDIENILMYESLEECRLQQEL